jgi:hypothetical protein
MEFAVGVMLVLLGVMSLSGITSIRDAVAPYKVTAIRAYTHTGTTHTLTLTVTVLADTGTGQNRRRRHGWTAIWASCPFISCCDRYRGHCPWARQTHCRGTAGAQCIRDPWWGVVPLLVYGLGTVAGMMLITAAIAAPFAYSASSCRALTFMRLASGVLSLGFGLFLMFYIGYVDGLFTDHPKWS